MKQYLHKGLVILLHVFSLIVTEMNAQTTFNSDEYGYWNGYSELMPNQVISTFDPVPGVCGFECTQFQLFDENKSPTGATNGFNSSGYNTSSLAEAIEENDYFWFDIAAITDTVLLDSVILELRKSNTGPTAVNFSYATSPSHSAAFTSLETISGLPVGSAHEFTLSVNTNIRINPGQTFRFRLASWGASNTSGTIRIKNKSYIVGFTGAQNNAAAKFMYESFSKFDTICDGISYTLPIFSSSIGDTVFYRKISADDVLSYVNVIPESGYFNANTSELSIGVNQFIIDSCKKTNLCIATNIDTDTFNLYINANDHLITDTSVSLCNGESFHWLGHEIHASGIYTANYINQNGCDSIVSLNATVILTPEASTDGFDFITNYFSDPYRVSFSPVNPIAVNEYYWDFGDGNTSAISHPVHIYADFGVYNVRLFVSNECGNTNDTLQIFVKDSNTTGIESNITKLFSIFPIPCEKELFIENTTGENIKLLNIFNALGQKISIHFESDKNGIKLFTESLSSGLYFVELQEKNGDVSYLKFMRR